MRMRVTVGKRGERRSMCEELGLTTRARFHDSSRLSQSFAYSFLSTIELSLSGRGPLVVLAGCSETGAFPDSFVICA